MPFATAGSRSLEARRSKLVNTIPGVNRSLVICSPKGGAGSLREGKPDGVSQPKQTENTKN